MIYLDYTASAPPFPEVICRMSEVAGCAYGNPGAIHQAGAQARQILQESRKILAAALNVRPEEVFFTSGATEANNWALAIATADPRKKHIVCGKTEHSSLLKPVKQLQQKGYEVTFLSPDRQGRIHPEDAEMALRQDTALLCVQAVNNETGVIQDVQALAAVARKHRVPYLCDAVQSFGHVQQPLHKADMICLSAHKFGGPRGIGCLVIRQNLPAKPLLLGGGQEFGLRSGTENLPAIAGFALAVQLAQEQPHQEVLSRMLAQGFREICPELEIAGEEAHRSSILCCRFPGISGEKIVARLDQLGICASPGAACAAGSGKPSPVLLAMGYTESQAREFVRFSPGRLTTPEQIRAVVKAMEQILA